MFRPDHDVVSAPDLGALLGADGILLDDLLDEGLRAGGSRVRPPEEGARERREENQHGTGRSTWSSRAAEQRANDQLERLSRARLGGRRKDVRGGARGYQGEGRRSKDSRTAA